ncbi:MAG: translation elongation factor Ts, partial [bacterium]
GMMDCKKALEETNGDIEKAIDLLRKKGADIAAKRADYETNNGRVEAYVATDFRSGALIEVACETDFSANTDAMKEFALHVAKSAQQENIAKPEELLQKNTALKKQLDELLAKIAEKIFISKIAFFAVDNHGIVNYYIHPGSQVGVMIELATSNDIHGSLEALKQIARDICMHIAVTRPLAIAPENVDQTLVEKEKDIVKEQLKDSKKPANILDKIIEGKLKKFYADNCLLHQAYIKNEDQTIEQYLKEQSDKLKNVISVKRYNIFVIGK